jgi:hypothetical protein
MMSYTALLAMQACSSLSKAEHADATVRLLLATDTAFYSGSHHSLLAMRAWLQVSRPPLLHSHVTN